MDAFTENLSGSMVPRLAFAVVSAAVLAVWLHRAARSTEAEPPRLTGRLRAAALALAAFWSVVWLALAALRIGHPYELEWCGGAMRDHAERVMQGLALYVPPGAGWFPIEYPPLYFWAGGMLMKATGWNSFVPLRIVSILSTLACAVLLFAWGRRLAPRCGGAWPLLTAGILLASYRFTGAWFDIERIDMLFLALSLLGAWWLQRAVEADCPVRAVASAGALALAILTKQQAVLFVLGGAAALAALRRWRLLAAFGGGWAVLGGGSVLALSLASDGWFWHYCWVVPMANGIKWNLAALYLLGDLPLFAPMIALGAGSLALLRRRDAHGDPLLVPLAWLTLAGVLGSWLSRAHWGGDQNVLIAGFLFLGLAGCTLAARAERLAPSAGPVLYGIAIVQLLVLTYRPGAQVPTPAHREAGRRYVERIRALEREGPVLAPDHGGVTLPRRFHTMGLHDILNAHRGVPPELERALREHRFAAIVTDAPPPTGGLPDVVARFYEPAESLGLSRSWILTGYPTPGPTRPVWILRPRRDDGGKAEAARRAGSVQAAGGG